MRITIDTTERSITLISSSGQSTYPLYSKPGFEILSREWLKAGWNLDHWSGFSWLGYRILQLPEDVLRLQEVVYTLRPDVIVETGIYQGGSTVFFASLCQLMGKGRVVSVELSFQPGVRQALESHPSASRIKLFAGDSCSPHIFSRIAEETAGAGSVLVFLDSNHSKAHVARELALYSRLVTVGSYIIAADGTMQVLADTPKGDLSWHQDNPAAAAREFAAEHPEFRLQPPKPLFTSDAHHDQLTYFSDGWLRRIAS